MSYDAKRDIKKKTQTNEELSTDDVSKAIKETKSHSPSSLQTQIHRESRKVDQFRTMASKEVQDVSIKIQNQLGSKANASDVAPLKQKVPLLERLLQKVSGELASLGSKVSQAFYRLTQVESKCNDISNRLNCLSAERRRSDTQIETKLTSHNIELIRLAEAISGNINLYLEIPSENINASDLNSADAYAYYKECDVSIVSEVTIDAQTIRFTHPWANIPVILATEAAGDPDILPPDIDWRDDPLADPKFVRGVLRLKIIFDTDAGVTKTYIAGDQVTVEIKVAADDKLLGWAVLPITKTYNVI